MSATAPIDLDRASTDEQLDPGLREAFLTHLGLPDGVPPDRDGLERVYRAWCAAMPYDNGRIREGLSSGDPERPLTAPVEELLRETIRDGRSGQCTETADALYCLLRDLGFDTYLCPSYYGGRRKDGLEVNHIAVVSVIDRQWFLTDTVMLTGQVLPLVEGVTHLAPLDYTVSRDDMGSWRIDTVTPVSRSALRARLFFLTRDRSVCASIFAQVQTDGFAEFNATYYGRRTHDGEIVTLSTAPTDRSWVTLHRTAVDGTRSVDCRTREERLTAMTEGLGFSRRYAAALPADEALA